MISRKKLPQIKILDLSSNLIKTSFPSSKLNEINMKLSEKIDSRSIRRLNYSSFHDSKIKTDSKFFRYDKEKKCYFTKKTIIIRFYYPKDDFIDIIPRLDYSTFRLYDIKKKEFIQCSKDIEHSTFLLYTNYPSFHVEGLPCNNIDRFTNFEFVLKNCVCYCNFYQDEKDRHQDQDPFQYTFLTLSPLFKELTKGKELSIKKIIEEGYNHIKNDQFVGEQSRYYKIYEFMNEYYIKNQKIDKLHYKGIKFDIYPSITSSSNKIITSEESNEIDEIQVNEINERNLNQQQSEYQEENKDILFEELPQDLLNLYQ